MNKVTAEFELAVTTIAEGVFSATQPKKINRKWREIEHIKDNFELAKLERDNNEYLLDMEI